MFFHFDIWIAAFKLNDNHLILYNMNPSVISSSEYIFCQWIIFCQSDLFLFNPFSAGTVFRCEFLTSKDGLHTEGIKIFMMVVDP